MVMGHEAMLATLDSSTSIEVISFLGGLPPGHEALEDVLKITQATALTLHDVDHTMTLPPSLGEGLSLTLHHPPEKSPFGKVVLRKSRLSKK